MIKKSLFLLFLGWALNSCDCLYHHSGIVIDQSTGQPLLNVEISKTEAGDILKNSQSKIFSNEKGEYYYSKIAGRCDEINLTFIKEGYDTLKIDLLNNSVDTIFMQAISKPEPMRFDPNQHFELRSIRHLSDYPSSYKDTSICLEWNLKPAEVKTILQNARAISGSEWHYLFGHYPCQIEGKLQQGAYKFEYAINSGAWLTISSKDTTMLYGSFKPENNQYFLDSAWTED